MNEVQYIEQDGKLAFAVVPIAVWNRLRQIAEDAADVAAFDQAIAGDDGSRFPADVVAALSDGATPIKAWRKHRRLTLQDLATRAGISRAFISQLENRKREPSSETLRLLAAALDVTPGELVA